MAPDHPLVAGHKGPVLDIAWCKHNDNVIGELDLVMGQRNSIEQSKEGSSYAKLYCVQ